MLHFLRSAVAVVGVAFDNKSDTSWAIGFVHHLLKFCARARGFVYGAVNIVAWHIFGLCLLYCCSKSWSRTITFSLFCFDLDKTHELRKCFAFLCVSLCLLVFDLRPLAMSCHE